MKSILQQGLLSLSAIAALGVLSCQTTDSWSTSSSSSKQTTAASTKPLKQEASTKTTNAVKPVATKPAAAPAPSSAPKGMLSSRMAYPTGNMQTSAVLVESFVPADVSVGQEFETQTKVTNLTSLTLDNVVLVQSSYGDFTTKSSSPKPVVDGNNTNWNLGSLGPNESRTIRTTGSANKAQPLSSCVSVTYASSLCINIPVVEPKLSLVASGPQSASQCDDIVYEYVVSNPGTGSAKDVKVTGTLPNGMTVNGKTSFTKTIGTLESKESKTFTIKVDAARTGNFQHMASAKSLSGLEAKSSTVATVVSKPVLTISATGPKSGFAGRHVKYDIIVKNIGDGIAKDVVLEESIPANAKYRSSTEGGKLATGQVQWNLGDMKPNQIRKVSVNFTLESIGKYSSRATALATCADSVNATVATEVRGIPAILLEVVDVEDPIFVGDDLTYVITVTNQGTAPATGVRIAVTIPASTNLVTATGSTAGPAAGSKLQKFSFAPVGSIAPKKTVSWKVTVHGTKSDDARFRVSMTSDQLTSPVDETEATNFYE